MKKFFATAVISFVVINLNAQLVDISHAVKTSYGVKVNSNMNLRFAEGSKNITAVTALATASFGDYSAWGGAMELRRQHTYWSAFGQVGTEHSTDFGWSNRALVGVGANTPSQKVVSIGLDGGFGFNQSHLTTDFANGAGLFSRETTSIWKPFAVAQIVLNFNLSKAVALTVRGGVQHTFVANNDKAEKPEGVWQVEGQDNDANRFFAQLGLTYKMERSSQISGDNCWRAAAFGGYSNKGWYGGAEALHYKRFSANMGRDLGFGAQWTKGDKDPLNEVFVKAGLTVLPTGADSPVVFPFGISAGFGEFERTNNSLTAADGGKSLTEHSEYASYGADAKVYAGIEGHVKRVTFAARGFVGGYKCVGKSYEDATNLQYDGTKGKTSGVLYGGEVRVSLAF